MDLEARRRRVQRAVGAGVVRAASGGVLLTLLLASLFFGLRLGVLTVVFLAISIPGPLFAVVLVAAHEHLYRRHLRGELAELPVEERRELLTSLAADHRTRAVAVSLLKELPSRGHELAPAEAPGGRGDEVAPARKALSNDDACGR